MPTEQKKVIQLKGEGNAFFKEKSFDAAIDKYTEAIILDPQNSSLYANRAACNWALKRYIDLLYPTNTNHFYDEGIKKSSTILKRSFKWSPP